MRNQVALQGHLVADAGVQANGQALRSGVELRTCPK